MNMAIVQGKVYQPTEQTKRIIELAKEALGGVEEAKRRVNLSIEAACRCGSLLNAEQKKVTKEMGRGYWMSYFEINFSKYVQYRTARRWMCMAIAHRVKSPSDIAILEDPKVDELTASLGQNPSNTVIRSGMLALGFFPQKTPLPIDGNRPTHRPSSHLSIINRFKAWYTDLRKQTNYSPMTIEQRAQLKEDFREVKAFIDEVFAS